MASCLTLLREAFPDHDAEFIQTMHTLLEEVRLDGSIGLKEKSVKYKKLLTEGKGAKALRVKNKINDELKLNKNVDDAIRAKTRGGGVILDRKGHLEGALSPLENIESNEITVNSVADSNKEMLLATMDQKIKAEGLVDIVKGGKLDELVMEVMFTGKKSKDAVVNKLASIYKSMNEMQRQMLNHSGASIFKRADFIHKQFHNGEAIGKVPFKEWAEFITSRLDMDNSFKGMKPDEVEAKLKEDYDRFQRKHDSILGHESEGNQEAKRTRNTTIDLLNKGRTYQFKSGADFKAYNDKFGSQRSLHSTLTTEYARAAKKAALIQKFGSSPKAGYDKFITRYLDKIGVTKAEGEAIRDEANIAFGIANGNGSFGIDNKLARYSNNIRSWAVLTKLGKAAFSAVMDINPTIMASKTATGDNIIKTGSRAIFSSLNGLAKSDRIRVADEMLLSIDAYNDALKEAMMGGSYKPGAMNKAINGMFKYSGLDFITSVSRRANADLAIKDLRSMAANTGKPTIEKTNFMKRYDLSNKEMKIIADNKHLTPSLMNEMSPKELGLTPKEFRALQQKMHIVVNQRVQRGSPLPDNRTRRRLFLNTRAGTLKGEGARYFAQFKSAIMKITQDAEYMLKATSKDGNIMNTNTAIAGAQFFILAATVGISRNMLVDYLKQGDDFDFEEWITNPVNITRGVATGGGAAIYGDILAPFFENRGWVGPTMAVGSFVAGPTGTEIIKGSAAIFGNLSKGEPDKNTAKFITNNIPYQNMWYLMNLNTKIAELLAEEFE